MHSDYETEKIRGHTVMYMTRFHGLGFQAQTQMWYRTRKDNKTVIEDCWEKGKM